MVFFNECYFSKSECSEKGQIRRILYFVWERAGMIWTENTKFKTSFTLTIFKIFSPNHLISFLVFSLLFYPFLSFSKQRIKDNYLIFPCSLQTPSSFRLFKKSPTRRTKSRWEPLAVEKSASESAPRNSNAIRYGGWKPATERDQKVTTNFLMTTV